MHVPVSVLYPSLSELFILKTRGLITVLSDSLTFYLLLFQGSARFSLQNERSGQGEVEETSASGLKQMGREIAVSLSWPEKQGRKAFFHSIYSLAASMTQVMRLPHTPCGTN